MDREFIVLNGKRPLHKFKRPEDTKSWDEVKDAEAIGLIIPQGFAVLDFDTKSDAEIMLKIIKRLNLKCRVMKTNKGIHVWFANTKVRITKNFVKRRLACGIISDSRSDQSRGFVRIREGGKMFDWILKTKWDELQEVPKFLMAIGAPSDKFNFKNMTDGDGRNQELYNYIVYLQGKGFKRAEIRTTIKIINEFVFADPLPADEIKLLTRDEAFKDDEEIIEQIKVKKEKKIKSEFKHNDFADELIQTYNIITLNGKMFVYEDGYYQEDERIIERKMIDLFPQITNRQRAEVLSYIKIISHKPYADIEVNPYTINLMNTRLDVRTGDSLPFSPEFIEFDRIPVKYDPDAYSADLDKMLNRVFMGDTEVINLFDEMVGYILIKHSRYRAGFMLYGSGRNGKSTILNLLKKFIGSSNYTPIELDKLTDRFSTAELEHKLANIGDDINETAIKNTGTLKKLFTGESLQVERKGERPFTLLPYAKMIFSMNEIPRSYDKSDGFYSRLMFIPFHATFEKGSADFDPNIADKIMTDNSLSYLLNRALRGAQRLMARGAFAQPTAVKEAMELYKQSNSIVLQWIQDDGLTPDDLQAKPANDLFKDYDDWCVNSGIKTHERSGKIKFYKEIEHVFGFTQAQRRYNGEARQRFFVYNLED